MTKTRINFKSVCSAKEEVKQLHTASIVVMFASTLALFNNVCKYMLQTFFGSS